jgi:hypothetical protein
MKSTAGNGLGQTTRIALPAWGNSSSRLARKRVSEAGAISMFKGAAISAQTIGSLREVTIEFQPNILGKLVGAGNKPMIFRNNGEMWFWLSTGNRVAPEMVTFLENAWSMYQTHLKSTN